MLFLSKANVDADYNDL